MTIPAHAIDSTAAAEHRAALAEAAAERLAADAEHAQKCVDGWLGLDVEERPRPCPRCRPHLTAARCRTCNALQDTCDTLLAARRGRCCDHCHHHDEVTR